MVMLEDQSEERAALYALGLLEENDVRAFEAEAAGNPALARAATELQETLANLALSTTPMHLPPPDVHTSLLARIEAEPARVSTDRWGHIEEINPAFTRLCGYRFEELRGRKPGHVLQGPGTDPADVDVLRRAVKAGAAAEVEMTNYHKDGSAYRVRVAIEPRRNDAGEVVGFRATEHRLAGSLG